MTRKLFILLFSAIFLVACAKDNKEQQSSDEDFNVPAEETQNTDIEISDETLQDIVSSFSSPIEMAAYVKESGARFSKKYLSPIDNIDQLNTDFEKALGLGVLSTDLGYLNIYEQTAPIISLITEIKRLADDLEIGQFFNFETMKDLAMSNTHLDSLMMVSTRSFNDMDAHLRNNGRGKLSTLMLAGVWIEGQYLATQIVKNTNQEDIRELIGEQKVILNDLIVILENYQSDPAVSDLIEELKALQNAFKDVEITYTVGESKSEVIDGRLTVYQETESHVTISEESLQAIINETEKVRNNIIKL